MSLTRLNTISLLALLTAIPTYSFAKTLIIDTSLEQQDSRNMNFDLVHYHPGFSPYDAQFIVENGMFRYPCAEFERQLHNIKNDENEIFEYMLKCEENISLSSLDNFQKRKFESQNKQPYVDRYHEYINRYYQYLNSISEIHIRNLYSEFEPNMYNFETGIYTGKIGNETESYWSPIELYDIVQHRIDPELPIIRIPANDFETVWNPTFGEKTIKISIPENIAQELYEKNAMVSTTVKFKRKINVAPEALKECTQSYRLDIYNYHTAIDRCYWKVFFEPDENLSIEFIEPITLERRFASGAGITGRFSFVPDPTSSLYKDYYDTYHEPEKGKLALDLSRYSDSIEHKVIYSTRKMEKRVVKQPDSEKASVEYIYSN